MTEAERRSALEAIASEVRECTRCRLSETRTQAVPGEGHPSTEVLFVGEGPGLNEDRQGRPFVGAAGQFLEELLGSVGWTRQEVYITNVVKCRPPQNRDPEPDEIAACAPYLQRQLDVLDPSLVVTLGRHSMGRFMPGARIGQVHGTFRPVPDGMGGSDALVFAMYHPAAALHQGSLRQTLLDDMTQVPAALVEARRRRAVAAGEGTADGIAVGVEGVAVEVADAAVGVEGVAVEVADAAVGVEGVAVEVPAASPEPAPGEPPSVAPGGAPVAREADAARDAVAGDTEIEPAAQLPDPIDRREAGPSATDRREPGPPTPAHAAIERSAGRDRPASSAVDAVTDTGAEDRTVEDVREATHMPETPATAPDGGPASTAGVLVAAVPADERAPDDQMTLFQS